MIDKNEPAFPFLCPSGEQFPGLTIRQYFAAMAMSDMVGKKYGHVDGYDGQGNKLENFSDANDCAKLSVLYADALIAELEKKAEGK